METLSVNAALTGDSTAKEKRYYLRFLINSLCNCLSYLL